MPVVSIELRRIARLVGANPRSIIKRLPYAGLDIESVSKDSIRVEYSPNRPDFGTDFGIARALRGLFGKEVGLPAYRTSSSGMTVSVDRRLSTIRPYIACAAATGIKLDNEDIRQILSLQEDLHNGLGRKRRVVAIGLHDLHRVEGPFKYEAVDSSFSFRPLDSKRELTISQILSETEPGRLYGRVLPAGSLFPVIVDAKGTVLSFPPIINGSATKVTTGTRSLFIDVTSTDARVGDDVLAIMSTTLIETGAKIGSVAVRYRNETRITPDLREQEFRLDTALVEQLLGLGLTKGRIADSLRRSRLALRGDRVFAPRYRIDLLHPVDIVEEVALGYGVDKIGSLYPASNRPGAFNAMEQFLDRASTIMAGTGMTELMTFELVDEKSLYTNFERQSKSKIAVHDPRSLQHFLLRDSLVPSLMSALSSNGKEDYPQRVFEIGRVYLRSETRVTESWHLGCLVAHTQASFTEAKMYLEALCRTLAGCELSTKQYLHWAFSPGRTASVSVGSELLGVVGELKPEALAAFRVNVPVAGFEIDLPRLREQLK
jgi:phenylalanyl-tRNA synthetase beta chain